MKYGVFIVESLKLEEEKDKSLDGWILKQMLDLQDVKNVYYYIRTEEELKHILEEFKKSDYGFFHLSCHGSKMSLNLTFDIIDFEHFAFNYGSYFYERRLFLSCCEASCFDFAKEMIPRFHPYSIIGCPIKISFSASAVFWSAFYFQMIELGESKMSQKFIIPVLQGLTSIFNLPMNYYSIIRTQNPVAKTHLREIKYGGSKGIIYDAPRETPYEDIFFLTRQPIKT